MPLSQLAETVRSVPAETTLREAAHIMQRDAIGALLVRKEADGPVEGIVTDRDLVLRIAEGADPATETLDRFAGRVVHTAREDASRAEITQVMRSNGVRRIPLVDAEGEVVRIVSLDDVLIGLGEEIFNLGRAIRVEMRHEPLSRDVDD